MLRSPAQVSGKNYHDRQDVLRVQKAVVGSRTWVGSIALVGFSGLGFVLSFH